MQTMVVEVAILMAVLASMVGTNVTMTTAPAVASVMVMFALFIMVVAVAAVIALIIMAARMVMIRVIAVAVTVFQTTVILMIIKKIIAASGEACKHKHFIFLRYLGSRTSLSKCFRLL